MVESKKKDGDYFKRDPWIVGLICDCLDLYGCPRTKEDCLSKEEEVWYMYSSLFLIGFIENMDDARLQSLRNMETKQAALECAKDYEDEYFEPLIMPFRGKEEIIS